MNCIPRRFSDIHLGSMGILFCRHLHGDASPVLLDCTWWCLLRVPPAPDAFLSFTLPSASHALFCTDNEFHVGTFIAMAVVFVPNVSEMGLSLLSEYPNNRSFLLGMRGRRLTLFSLLVVFRILRLVISSFPLLSSFCISCECHCTNKDHSPLSSFVSWG